MKTVKEMIEVMQAHLDGRKIEAKQTSEKYSSWSDVGKPVWDWYGCDYRIKPEEVKVYLYRNRRTGALFASIYLCPEEEAELAGQGTIMAEGCQSHRPKRKIQ